MQLTLHYPARPLTSRLLFGRGLDIASFLPKKKRLALLVDENIVPLVQKNKIPGELFCIPSGDRHKTRQTKEFIEDALLKAGFGRDSAIIGCGGGVTTDIAGFVAATFCRGVPFIAIPTTLMGMTDASIGGKTAVNTPFAKNSIGAFHPPSSVIIDTAFLDTLSEEQMQEGLSEIIKHALIASPELFAKLMENREAWAKRDPTFLDEIVYESCAIKARVVEQDPWETGLRRILNFGHTIGHALETVSKHAISHGRAVAIGMMMELRLFPCKEIGRIEKLYELYRLPLSAQYTLSELTAAMQLDKKNAGGKVRIVTLDAIGQASFHNGEYCTPIEIL